jgi:putative inorganic carbon (HCO3(-)) transporter
VAATATRLPSVKVGAAVPGRWDLAFFGVLLYLLVEYFRPGEKYAMLANLGLGKLVVGLALLGWIVSPSLNRDKQVSTSALDFGIVGFVIASFLASCFAQFQDWAWIGFTDTVRLAVIYFVISRVVASPWRLRIFAFLLILLNLKMAQFVVRNYVLARSTGLSEMTIITRGVGAGSAGLFADSGDLGVAMCVAWPLGIALFFGESKKFWKLFLIGSSLACLAAALVCGSRGAVVGVVASVIVALARNPRKLAAAFMVLLLLLGALFVLPGASKERFRSAMDWRQDPTSMDRIYLWRAGFRMFADHPLVGVGPNNFAPLRASYSKLDEPVARQWVAHSIYMQALTELGSLGTIFELALIVCFLRLNARTRKRLKALQEKGRPSFEYCLAVGLDLAFVGYLVSGAFITVLYYPHLWVLLGMAGGLARACVGQPQEKVQAAAQKSKPRYALATS